MLRPQKRLGEILIGRELITEAQLEEGLAEQRLTKEFLGLILIRKGFITKERFLQALSEQFKIPLLKLDELTVDLDVAVRFPASIVVDHKCVPIKQDETHFTVAILDPLDAMALSEIEERAKPLPIKWVLLSEDDINTLVARYREKMKENMRRLLSGE